MPPRETPTTKISKPPSLKEFDYFAEDEDYQVAMRHTETLEEETPPRNALTEKMERFQAQRRRYSRAFALMFLTLSVLLWAASGYLDEIRYEFSTSAIPIEMGNASDHRADDYTHNTFVHIKAITEHRGLEQKRVRGLTPVRNQYWYFRLIGSRGVFVEVPNDRERFGPTTRIDVVGRVIDPKMDKGFADVLRQYYSTFPTALQRASARIIQVDRIPGQSKLGFIVVAGFILILLGSNILTLRRLLRAHRGLTRLR